MAKDTTGNTPAYVDLSCGDPPVGLTVPISSEDDTPEPPQPFPNPRSHAEFYEIFKREADEYDSGLIKKYSDDMTTTLIFVGFPLCPSLIPGPVLTTEKLGRFLLCGHNYLHRYYPGTAPTRLHTDELRPSFRHRQRLTREHSNRH